MTPSRRKFLRHATIGVAGAVSLTAAYLWRRSVFGFELPKKPTPKPVTYGVKHEVKIPGAATYDIDSMRLPGQKEFVRWNLRGSGAQSTLDYETLDFGADFRYTDLYWEHITQIERQLVPEHGAEFAIIKKRFDDVTLEDLLKAQYSSAPISGSDNNDQMPLGTVIGIKTNEGNYAKMSIDGFLPLKRRMYFSSPSDISRYHLKCTLLLYKPQGQ